VTRIGFCDRSPRSGLVAQEFRQNLCTAYRDLLCRSEQEDASLGEQLMKVRNCSGVHFVGELAVIAPRELGELVGFVAVPFAKRSRGSDVFAPFIEAGALLADAAWPQPVYENS
jgi:hypothetical protein